MVWVVGQALVNIAVVLGLLPVLGVPLPLISAGGSALIATLLAIGVVLSFARGAGQDRPVTTYLLTGGGTAGHVNPLLAVADRLRETEPDAEVLVLGTRGGARGAARPGARLRAAHRRPAAVPAAPRPRGAAVPVAGGGPTSQRPRSTSPTACVDAVVGFGGYASAPAYVAAHRAGTPDRDP